MRTMRTNLRSIRIDAGYTQKSLGEELGCTYGAVFAWEHGIAWPYPAIGRRLRDFFDLPLDVLLAPAPEHNEKATASR